MEVETEEHAVGGAGEMQQEVTNVTRARTKPSFTFRVDSKYALINPTHGNTPPRRPTDALPDWYDNWYLARSNRVDNYSVVEDTRLDDNTSYDGC